MRLTKSAGWALVLTSVAFFMTALDALVVITALPKIHASLGGSVSTLEWTVNAYTLTLAAGIITAAALGDRFGRRRMYVVGLVLFTAASAACELAPSAGLLIGARAIQGLGAALITPLSLTIVASAFPAERRGTVVGIQGAIGGLAIAGGPVVGGAVVYGLDWHWIFWLNVPVGAVAVPAAGEPRSAFEARPGGRGPGDRRRGGAGLGTGPDHRRRLGQPAGHRRTDRRRRADRRLRGLGTAGQRAHAAAAPAA